MNIHQNNYVVGRGRLFFGQFKPSTRKANGQRYLGNTPELSTSQSEDTLDHYSSEGGVRIKDASVTLQNDSSGSFQCDDISPANLALWFRGIVQSRIEAGSALATGTFVFSTAAPVEGDLVSINGTDLVFSATAGPNVISPLPATIGDAADALAAAITVISASLGVTAVSDNVNTVTLTSIEAGTEGNATTTTATFTAPANMTVSGATLGGGTDVTENFVDVQTGVWYQLGVDTSTPQGIRNVGSFAVTGLTDADFTVEAANGRFMLHDDGAATAGATIETTYGIVASTETVVIAKGESIEGELAFTADNPAGKNDDYYWPMVRLTPDGDLSLKGDDWMTTTFNFEILKRDDATERQYITRR